MRRLPLVFFTLAVWLVPAAAVHAADKFPSVITAEADFSEGDLEKARKEAREAGLRAAVLDALRAEVGQGAIDDNPLVVRAKFLNAYGEFIVSSGVLSETKAGLRLNLTLGYELDREKLKARIVALKLQPAERRAKVFVLWSDEDRNGKADDKLGDGSALAGARTSWSEGATAPADLREMSAALAANGFDVVEASAAVRAWVRRELNGAEVTKQFLRAVTRHAGAGATVYLRVVHRRVDGPPAARMRFLRVHHVAFVFDAAKDDLAGPPVAMPVVSVEAGTPGRDEPVPSEWINRVLAQLVSDNPPGARLLVKGIASAGRFDEVWANLRKIEALGSVVPRRLSATAVEFEFGNPPDDAAREALVKALPGEWKTGAAEWSVVLTPAKAPAPGKPKRP